MSIATMNWALRQRLASPQQQILLYVIADSADPNGVTRHCDPDYLVKHSRLSRASVFRRLNDLRTEGLIETFNKHGDRGDRIYEIRLQLERFVDVPSRRHADDDDHSEDHESQVETQPQSQAETQAESKVSPVRPGESHCCDYISPTLSEESPPTPSSEGVSDQKSEQASEPEHFEPFFTQCLGWRTMSRELALQAFGFLTPDEQGRARAAAPLHADECTKFKRRSKDAHKLIRERFWERYPNAKLPDKPREPVWISEAEIAALAVVYRILDVSPPRLVDDPVRGRGLWRSMPIEPDLAAMGRLIDVDIREWPMISADSKEFNAWRHRLHDWTGLWAEPRKRWLEPFDPLVHGLSPSHPDFKMRRAEHGLPVPVPWPPRKDGTLSPDTPSPTMTPDDVETFAKEGTR